MRKHDYALLNPKTGQVTLITSLTGKKKGDTLTVCVPILNEEKVAQDKLTEEQIDAYIEAHPDLEKHEFTVELDQEVHPLN